MVALVPGTEEYTCTLKLFQDTMSGASWQVEGIERIQKKFHHEGFYVNLNASKAKWGDQFDELRMVRTLFHGTSSSAAKEIINGDHGFLPHLSGERVGQIFGVGTYFARDAKYSHQFAETMKGGSKKLFLVKVISLSHLLCPLVGRLNCF